MAISLTITANSRSLFEMNKKYIYEDNKIPGVEVLTLLYRVNKLGMQETFKIMKKTLPECDGEIYDNFFGDSVIKCTKCEGWFFF